MNTKQQFKKSMSEYRQELTEAYKKDNKAQFHTVMNRNKFLDSFTAPYDVQAMSAYLWMKLDGIGRTPKRTAIAYN